MMWHIVSLLNPGRSYPGSPSPKYCPSIAPRKYLRMSAIDLETALYFLHQIRILFNIIGQMMTYHSTQMPHRGTYTKCYRCEPHRHNLWVIFEWVIHEQHLGLSFPIWSKAFSISPIIATLWIQKFMRTPSKSAYRGSGTSKQSFSETLPAILEEQS